MEAVAGNSDRLGERGCDFKWERASMKSPHGLVCKGVGGCSGNQNNVLVSMRHQHEGPRSCGRGGMIVDDRIAFFSSGAAQNTLNRRNYISIGGIRHIACSHAGSTSDDQVTPVQYRAVPRTAKHLCASLCGQSTEVN